MRTGWQGRAMRGVAVLAACALAVVAVAARAQVSPFAVVKSFAPTTILSGNPARLTVRLVNNTSGMVQPVGLSDTFPAGMQLVAGVDPAAQCGGTVTTSPGGFTFVGGILAPISTCNVTVTVTVLAATGGNYTNTTSTVFFGGQGVPGATATLGVVGGVPPAITSPRPPDGQVGVPYDHVVTVTGTGPITVSVSGLPPGLTFAPAISRITGIPTVAGAYPGSISAANGFLPNDTQSYTVNVALPAPLAIVTPEPLAPPIPIQGSVDIQLQATGGLAPYTWSLAGGGLPPGVTLDPSGRVHGTATQGGLFVFDARVIDSLGNAAVRRYSIDVQKAASKLAFALTPNPAISGQTVQVAATVTGGAVAVSGGLEVWVAGTTSRCPAPFETGPRPETTQKKSAPLGPGGSVIVAFPNLPIDDYRVCARYSGDLLYAPADFGPVELTVIKGVLLAPPAVVLLAPERTPPAATLVTRVVVTPVVDTLQVPSGAVRVLEGTRSIGTAMLANGMARVDVPTLAQGTITLHAEYDGDGTFPPAQSPAVVVLIADGSAAIPASSPAALALLALALGGIAVRYLRRRN